MTPLETITRINELEEEIPRALRRMAEHPLTDTKGEKEHYITQLINEYERLTGENYNPVRVMEARG